LTFSLVALISSFLVYNEKKGAQPYFFLPFALELRLLLEDQVDHPVLLLQVLPLTANRHFSFR